MTAMDFDRLRRLVVEALDVPHEARLQFLEQQCGDDPAVFEAACKLLRHDTAPSGVLGDDTFLGRELEEQDLPPGERIGRYPVSHRIASGGMGVVYLATDPTLDREIAIKQLPNWLAREPEALERLREEAKNLAQLNHPHIATIYSLEMDGESSFLTMEFIPGESLAAALRRGPLDLDPTLRIMRGVASALEAAHAKGIAHRDLKPHNIMVTDRGDAKVLDFGLAVRIAGQTRASESAGQPRTGASAGQPRVSGPGDSRLGSDPSPGRLLQDRERSPLSWSSAGTPGYMSPERVQGRDDDSATDAWSFGCVLFECLSGVRAFGGSREERLRATLHDPAPMSALPSSVPPSLVRLIEECLVKDPGERLVSLRTARRVIEALLERRERERLDAEQRRTDLTSGLPHYLSRFVGRDEEIDEIKARLCAHRLVTLSGLGGCGKTRLAVEALSQSSHDAVWVDLAALEKPEQIAVAVLSALDVPTPSQDPLHQLSQILSDRELVLLMDNCEHLIAACRDLLKPLLRQCPGVRVLATSQEPLEIAGEAVLPVAPLAIPEPGHALPENPSVQLFLDRARILNPSLDPTGSAAATVVEICRRLEGIPLALEIAASQLDVLSLSELRDRLEQRLELSHAPRDDRHHSVRAVIDSSFQRLGPLEQSMLCRMSVFPGTWTLDAADAVGLADADKPWRTFELVKALARKSLIQRAHVPDAEAPARFRMLETVAEFAREKLRAAGEEPDAYRAMFRYYQDMFAAPSAQRPERWRLARVFRAEEDNVARAIDAAGQYLPVGQCARLVLAIAPLWKHCGRHQDGRRRCREALAALDRPGVEDRMLVGALLVELSAMLLRTSELEESQAAAERALPIAVELADPELEARALNSLGSVERRRDRLPEALAYCDRALAVGRSGQDLLEANIRFNRGVILLHLARTEEAEAEFRASLVTRETLGDETEVSESINALGVVASVRGNYEEARTRYEESLEIKRRTQYTQGMVTAFINLSRVTINLFRSLELDRDLLERSLSISDEGIALARQVGDGVGLAALYLARASAESLLGSLDAAETTARLGLEAARAVGSVRNEAAGDDVLAKIALQRGDFSTAQSYGEAAFALFLRGEPISIYQPLRTIARARFGLGDASGALVLLSASRAAAGRASARHSERDEQFIEEFEAKVAAQLDEAAVRDAVRIGETTPLERILDVIKGTGASS